jgi:hypothetical protein
LIVNVITGTYMDNLLWIENTHIPHCSVKFLASSLLRSNTNCHICFHNSHGLPLFRSANAEVTEFFHESPPILDEIIQSRPSWSKFSVICHISSNTIAVRNLDHLFKCEAAQILWAQYPIVASAIEVASGFDSPSGPMHNLNRVCANIFAVRTEFYKSVMAELKRLETQIASQDQGSTRHNAWAKLLIEGKFKSRPFERDEIAFPAYGSTYQECEEAALVCTEGWPAATQLSFLSGMYFSKYFADPQGTFLNILEP